MSRMEKMRGLLAVLQPTQIEIGDDSHKHARHRMIYFALGEMVKRNIHALHITAHTPEEL